MPNALQNYFEALGRFNAANKKLEDYASELELVAQALRSNPDKLQFTNLQSEPGVGVTVGKWRKDARDAKTFPRPEKIQAALNDWMSAKDAMKQAWAALPEDQRGSAPPPPD